MISAQLAVI